MMDNEAIVDQIVRSLSFEVVAVPQNVVQVESTSNSTPLNVKIRVRKRHGAELRHGVLSMPKVDTKSDSQKHELSERVRLVSSDQTIMNFNVLMEADFDKKQYNQNFNRISTGLEVNNTENPNLSKNTDNFNTAPILSKRNKDIFGRCKPGGCLDPPFGEDKYSYQPTQQNNSLPAKDDTAKPRNSSIFKNNLFKRKRKSSLVDDELIKSDTNHSNDVDSINNLNDKYPVEVSSPYSNSIITYSHSSDSSEFRKQEERKVSRDDIEQPYKKRHSKDDKSKTASIDDGSYFMIPKKTKKLSSQSDPNKIQKNYATPDEHNTKNNYLRTTSIPKNAVDESKIEPQAQLIPIPIVVPLNAPVNSKSTNNGTLNSNIVVQNNTQPSNGAKNKIKINSQTEIMTKCGTDNTIMDLTLETSSGTVNMENKISPTKTENELQVLRSVEPQDMSTNIFSKDSTRLSKNNLDAEHDAINGLLNIQRSENNEPDTTSEQIFTLKENYDISNIEETKENECNFHDQADLKSHLLLAEDRETSILDMSPDPIIPFSSANLNHIWKNDTEALKSMADVITSKTMQPTKYNEMLPNIFENSKINEEFSELEKTSAGDNYDHLKYDKEQFIHEAISESDLQERSASMHISKNNIVKNEGFDSSEKILGGYANVGGEKSSDASSKIVSGNFVDNKNHIHNFGKKGTVTQGENSDYVKTSDIIVHANEIETVDQMNNYGEIADKILRLSSLNHKLQKQNDNLKQSYEFAVDEVKDIIKLELMDTSSTSFSEDTFTVKSLYEKTRSVSDQSIMGSGSLRFIPDNSPSKDDKYLKINLESDLDETIKPQNREQKINDTAFKQMPNKTISSELERQKLNTQLDNRSDEINFKLDRVPSINFPEVVYGAYDAAQHNSLLHPPWKIDIALQSYIDENNERIIKTFDSKNVPENHTKDAVLVAKCYLGDELNEIKIPIDQDNDLSVKVISIKPPLIPAELSSDANSINEIFGHEKIKIYESDKSEYQSQVNVNDDSKNASYEKHKMKINVPASDSDIAVKYTDYKKLNKAKSDKYIKAIVSGDIRNALNSIYEEELVPLQGIIKGLREEIDALVAFQMKLRVKNLTSNRSKPLRLAHPHKKCCCLRRF